jgi:hypothetical protein
VLQLYNEETTVCKLYRDIVNDANNVVIGEDKGWVENVPWLYYDRSADDVLEDGDKVNMEVSFSESIDDKVHNLKYRLAMYKLDGSFLGFKALEDELILCPHSTDDTENFKEFGTNIVLK